MNTDTPLKILIIDDETEISQLLSRFLERKGYSVNSAGNLTEGKMLYMHAEYRYLILDINLPDGNGLDVLPYFKKVQPACDIIMMSAMASPQLHIESRKRGAMTMVGKPFSTQNIVSLLENGDPGQT